MRWKLFTATSLVSALLLWLLFTGTTPTTAGISGGGTFNPGIGLLATPWGRAWILHANDAAAWTDLGATTANQIPYFDATPALQYVANGIAGQVLTSNGAGVAPSMQALPAGFAAYAADVTATGTVYTVTAVDAAIDFGTVDPVITLPAGARNYIVTVRVQYDWVAATQAAEHTVYTSIVETGTPAVLKAITHVSPILNVASSATLGDTTFSTIYAATGGETLTLYTYVSALPDAGSLTVTAAEMMVQGL